MNRVLVAASFPVPARWRPAAGLLLLFTLLSPQAGALLAGAGCRWLAVLATAFLASFLLTPLMRHLAFLTGALDRPDHRKTHQAPTPLLGGVAVYGGLVLALLRNQILDPQSVAILAACALLVLVGVMDDVYNLGAKTKLAVQVLCALAVWGVGVRIELLPRFGVDAVWLPFLQGANVFLSLLWLVGITNAMNFLDGIDGLAAGLGAVMAAFLGVVALHTGQPQVGWFALAVLGGCLGFLPYNFRPGRPAAIFLGDAGSTAIGFALAALAIRGDWAEHRPLVSACTPILLFGVPIFDMVQTTVARIASGKVRSFHDWVAYVGRDHLHHRVHRLFRDRVLTVLFILGLAVLLGISAVVMRAVDLPLALLLLLQGMVGFGLFALADCYQERSLVRLDRERAGFRVQEAMDVQVVSGNGRADAVLLDISDRGARIMVHVSSGLAVGEAVSLLVDEVAGAVVPRGTVAWRRPLLVDGGAGGLDDSYLECGLRLHDFAGEPFMVFLQDLYRLQLLRRQRLLRPLAEPVQRAAAG